ncbi:MAG TPA: copper amine oxidase N-terminal domain-containing protein [Armatimonadota bacterium]|nr:copper amine oxidase N-terminal domain-containing protein [Armatimonadota bacterium]
MTRRCFPLLLLALMILIPTAVQGEDAVQAFIGNRPVDFVDSVPTALSQEVCVPVRQFAEALGASVYWDGSSGTLTVTGSSRAGVLRLGRQSGLVRGSRVSFPYAPYLHDGRFYAPVLFFNEMFDQAWYWDPLNKRLRWMPIFPRWRARATRPPMIIYGPAAEEPKPEEAGPVPATKTLVGEAVRVLPSSANPRITVRAAGSTATYRIARDAIILRGRIGGQAVELPLGNVRPGDRVTLRFDEQSTVISIRAQYKVSSGKVQSIAAGTILLETGEVLKVGPQTKIILPGNVSGQSGDMRAGDIVAASVSPITGRTYVIKVLHQGREGEQPPAEAEDDQIRLNSAGPLRAGDTLTVFFKADPGGQAWFTVPGARANIPMTETEPGLYRGDYAIQQGDIVIRQPISVTFSAPGGETYTRLSRRLVTAQTIAGYLPRITYPRQGQEIQSPVVVQGVAAPGSLVRVTIEFRREIQGIMPYEGMAAIEDVRADKDGHWQTGPMSLAAPFAERQPPIPPDFGAFTEIFKYPEEPPTIYTITATSVAGGREQAAYSVEVTRKPGVRIGG